MGLDIRVYKDIKECSQEDDYDFEAFVIDDRWLDRIKNLKNSALYTGTPCKETVGYPYSSHSQFRNMLGLMVGLKDSEWLDDNLDPETPFFELMHFADNEGCIDWETSEKLYGDFVKFKELASLHFKGLWLDRYYEWTAIFKRAKYKGVVVFR